MSLLGFVLYSHLLCGKMARQQVTVVLNGDGGDESFAGYQRYIGYKYASRLKDLPWPLLKGALSAAGLLNLFTGKNETRDFSRIYKYLGIVANYKKAADLSAPAFLFFTPEEKDQAL